jgi:hypothetical protein
MMVMKVLHHAIKFSFNNYEKQNLEVSFTHSFTTRQ